MALDLLEKIIEAEAIAKIPFRYLGFSKVDLYAFKDEAERKELKNAVRKRNP